MQQEVFQKWVNLWKVFPASVAVRSETVNFKKKWLVLMSELFKKQRESLEDQFGAGLQHIEDVFQLAGAKDTEELRSKTIELWQKAFACLRQTYEAQTRDFQNAVAQWTELVTKGAA
jgi:hypothetical protein